MALNKSKLYSDFEKIFNVEKSPEVQSETHAAQLITDAIVKYLNDAKIGGLKAPGINPTFASRSQSISTEHLLNMIKLDPHITTEIDEKQQYIIRKFLKTEIKINK